MVRRKEDLLIFITVITSCIRSIQCYYDYPTSREISVEFPKYNIKIEPAETQTFYEETPSNFEGYNEVGQGEEATASDFGNYWNNYYTPHQNGPIYQLEPEVQYPIYYLQPELQYPIITREPIATKKPCFLPYPHVHSYGRSAEDYNPEVGRPRSHRHKTDYFFTAPAWNSNNNMNILRSADPRSLISSHTHFVKIKKPIFGSKKIFFHSKKIIGDDHHFGSHDDFGGGHGHFGGGHFGQNTNIHKNTHIHINNRNANPPNNNYMSVLGSTNTQIQNKNNVERRANDDGKIIGSHLFAAPRWRRDTLTRKKRSFVDVAKLVTDHKTKLDFQKTAENVGAATRNLFEEDYSPVFHLTNALGAAHDSMYSLMNVRPSGILIPCRYRIVPANEIPSVAASSPMVGGINPAIYNLHGQTPPPPLSEDEAEEPYYNSAQDPADNSYDNQYFDSGDRGDPLQMIGDKLRESVQWAQKSAGHAVDAFHHTRNMIVNVRKSWPKLLLPYAGAIEVTKPKIGGQNEENVGTAKDPEYVGVGRMMDYLGMTDKKPDLTRVGGPRMITEEEMILKKAKDILGAPTYRHFLDDMKKHLEIGSAAKNELVGRPRLSQGNLQAKLALDRLRNALLLQRVKGDLKRLQIPKTPTVPKLPNSLLKPVKPLSIKPLNIPKPLTPVRSPLLRSSEPKQPLIQPLKPPGLKLPSPIKNKNEKLELVGSPLKTAPKPARKSSNPTLDKIRAALEAANKSKDPKIIPVTTTPKPVVLSPLEKLRARLHEKYNIPNDGKDHSDILGKTLAQFRNKNPEEVGTAQNSNKEPVPVPILTKEMKTPFMGLATKRDLEQYFKKLYCANCKPEDIK